jgi:hypothetical protein
MRRAIGNVLLRNEYTVYECIDCYEVESADRHGQRFTQEVPLEVVEFTRVRLAGLNVTTDEAAAALELAAEQLALPYTYGYKLRCSVPTSLTQFLTCLTQGSESFSPA